MTINTHRSRLIWSPLIGWMLLTCGMSVAQAQSPTQSDVDPSTTTPSLPPGGAAPPILTPGGTVGTQAPPSGAPRPGGATAEPAMTAPTSPSAGTTIVNSPFGS